MIDNCKEIIKSIEFFNGTGWFWLMWLVGVVWLFKRKGKGPHRDLLLIFAIIAVAAVNPLTGTILLKLLDDSYQVYSRLFWLLMMEPMIAVCVVEIIDFVRSSDEKEKAPSLRITAALLALCLMAGGAWMYVKGTVYFIDNRMEVSAPSIEVAEYILQHRKSEKDKCLVTDKYDILSEVRQVDGTIRLYYGRRHEEKIDYVLSLDEKEMKERLDYYRKRKVKFIFIPDKKKDTKKLRDNGWIKVDTLGDIAVYRPVKKYDKGWIIRSYVDRSGEQGLFYSIEKGDKLILVDGGWAENADQVRDVINEHGGHVDAWFITHYHNDHVDALNAILEDPGKIKIDKIYDTPIDPKYFHKHVKEWDTPKSFDKYVSLTKDMKNVVHLKRDDKFKVCGLDVLVLNSYDGTAKKKTSDDIANDASLMIKVSAKKQSILFCSDNHSKPLAKYLIKKYGDRLHSEYVQAGHHGNNSLPEEFYDKVSPDIAIFDAPKWLMEGKDYTAKDLKEYFESKDVKVADYTTNPNIFVLREI